LRNQRSCKREASGIEAINCQETWGELYIRTHIGMRAGCSLLRDFVGRDGAIRFYFTDGSAE
jgi:hypothetical protein